ncbi:MAG: hypothetical protein KAI47_14785, partial [Deltaproteobacteria bacterium]|nr:hypothetical protein [Deltaproteobacteria bacterium]
SGDQDASLDGGTHGELSFQDVSGDKPKDVLPRDSYVGDALLLADMNPTKKDGGLVGDVGAISDSKPGPTPFCLTCLKIKIGRAYRVNGPSPHIPDSPFFAVNTGNRIRAYTGGGGGTSLFEGPSMTTLVLQPKAVMTAGAAGQFDICGAWLHAVDPLTSPITGWYHAEEKCNYAIGQTHKSVAYATSTDGGKTFVKTGYPNNRVLTGTTAPTVGKGTGVGDFSVIRRGQYYWMYFYDFKYWRTAVARSLIASGGKPGTWTKWHQGSFSSPGLAGESTPLPVNGTEQFYGASATLFETGDQVAIITTDHYFGGLRLLFSSDGIHFKDLDEPLVPFKDGNWIRPADTELIAYPSIVPPNAGQGWKGDAYLFYSYIPPKKGFTDHYLVRRSMKVEQASSPQTSHVSLALNRYVDAAKTDHWITTAMVQDSYKDEGVLGYVRTKAFKGSTPLIGCYIPLWDDHMASVGTQCGPGNELLRTLGWIWSASTSPIPPGTKPLYRCFSQATLDHFLSTDPACEGGGKMEWMLGYIDL